MDALAEIKKIYYAATKTTIQNDLARAIDLLKTLPTEDDREKVAVYMDEAGKTHECSAICTHAAGIVSWNRAERSWDCPCHGSRFDPFGRVLTGPAKRDLDPGVERDRPEAPPPSAE